jgi:hypothetical protein
MSSTSSDTSNLSLHFCTFALGRHLSRAEAFSRALSESFTMDGLMFVLSMLVAGLCSSACFIAPDLVLILSAMEKLLRIVLVL